MMPLKNTSSLVVIASIGSFTMLIAISVSLIP